MFWDSSALVPIILPAQASTTLVTLVGADARRTLWWASPVECQSAVFRLHRETPLPAAALDGALRNLRDLVVASDVIPPTIPLRERAVRVLGGHPLRASDALQLAAALEWCENAPGGETFVCLDARLREATRREGFAVLPA